MAANVEICVGLKKDGNRCDRKAKDAQRCAMHFKMLTEWGHFEIRRIEQQSILKKQQKLLFHEYTRENDEIIATELAGDARAIRVQHAYALYTQGLREAHQLYDVNIRIIAHDERDDFAVHRIDRRGPKKLLEVVKMTLRRREMEEQRLYEGQLRNYFLWAVVPEEDGRRQYVMPGEGGRGRLQMFVEDRQNIHTTDAVRMTKTTIEKIREIKPSPEFCWSETKCSKTPFEIGLMLELSQAAANTMMMYYSQSTAIYDIEVGIYGKVLDSVWHFIKASDDRESLMRILKQELEDNIGMCAQGNLSRICNVLSGYVEGIRPVSSAATSLGDRLPPLREIADVDERVRQAKAILEEEGVAGDQQAAWLETLVD